MSETTTDRASLARRLHAAASEGLEANVRRWFHFAQYAPGEPIELQALDVPAGRVTCNKFAHGNSIEQVTALLTEAEAWGAPGIYFVLNRIDAAVATRETPGQWHVAKKGQATTDADIRARRFVYIDFDSRRPKGTSATREQVLAALAVAERVMTRFTALLGSDAMLAAGMSGNGAALYIALDDLPTTDDVTALVKGLLAVLSVLYGTSQVTVDASVCDLKRLTPGWGTTKRKGAPGVAERPHRRTAIVAPERVERIGLAGLEGVLNSLMIELSEEQRAQVDRAMGRKPTSAKKTTSAGTSDDVFARANACDIEEVLQHYGLYDGESVTCPGCGTVGGRGDTSVAILGGGMKCSHARCSLKGKNGFRTPVDVVAEREGVSPIEAVRILGTRFGFDVPPPRSERASSGGASPSATSTAPPDWPDPQPLGTSLAPVAPFDPTLMPGPFQAWAADVAHRLQAPADFAAVAAIIALGSVIGRAVGVRPKQRDDWMVVGNLWGAVVGESGIAKSPSMKAGLLFLNRLAADAFETFEQSVAAAATGEAVKEAEVKRLKRELQQSVDGKSGKPRKARPAGHLRVVEDEDEPETFEPPRRAEEIAAELQEVMKKDTAPPLRRFMVNDATVEKLGELLNQNDRGLLLFRDELPLTDPLTFSI